MPPADFDRELLTGNLTTLVLSLLCERPMYGYEILQEAARRSAQTLRMKEGSLYPALHQMERTGLLRADWRQSESGRARKYYALTARGRRAAAGKREQWEAMATAMRAILGSNAGE